MKYRLFLRKIGSLPFLKSEPEKIEYNAIDWDKANNVAKIKCEEKAKKEKNSCKIVMLAEIK